MQTVIKEFLISTSVACGLFSALKVDPPPPEPTLQDWVGKHEAYPVNEALVSDPSVDESVREQARQYYSIASIEVMIGGGLFDFDREPLPPSHFSSSNLSIELQVLEQPEAMWMLGRVFDKYWNNDAVFTCYHNGMVEDLPVNGRILFTFDVVDRHARVLQRKIDGGYLDTIAECVEGHIDGLEVADGIHELVTIEVTYEEKV